MTFEDILAALTPLLHEGETATITKSDDVGDRMISLNGTARETGIYDYGGLYVWYSQPGADAWAANDADAMNTQLPIMLDYARHPAGSGDLRGREAREMTPSNLIEQLSDLLAGGAPPVTGTLPGGIQVAEIDYGPGAIHIEKSAHDTTFSAWAITNGRRWEASKRDQTKAREAISDILAAIRTNSK
nr:MAG TPA: hypothetical protein [Caudoviricetes sp.]